MQLSKKVIQLIKWAEGYLTEKGIEAPRLDAEVLVAHALDKSRSQLYRDLQEVVKEEEIKQVEDLIEKRGSFIPTAYLIGVREFMSLNFKVSPAVLIPRPETEILVEEVIARGKGLEKPIIIDVGTGSGTISVSVAKYLPEAKVLATEISPPALEIAKENAALNGVANQITFFEGNLLDAIPRDYLGQVDGITANLPYIPDSEWSKLQAEVRLREPRLALTAGEDGFDLYRELIPVAWEFLKPGGFLLLEIGYHQGQIAKEIFKAPKWETCTVLQDYQALDRIILAIKK